MEGIIVRELKMGEERWRIIGMYVNKEMKVAINNIENGVR